MPSGDVATSRKASRSSLIASRSGSAAPFTITSSATYGARGLGRPMVAFWIIGSTIGFSASALARSAGGVRSMRRQRLAQEALGERGRRRAPAGITASIMRIAAASLALEVLAGEDGGEAGVAADRVVGVDQAAAARHALRAAETGEDVEADLRKADGRLLGGDDAAAGEGELVDAAEGEAVDHRQPGQRPVLDRVEHVVAAVDEAGRAGRGRRASARRCWRRRRARSLLPLRMTPVERRLGVDRAAAPRPAPRAPRPPPADSVFMPPESKVTQAMPLRISCVNIVAP